MTCKECGARSRKEEDICFKCEVMIENLEICVKRINDMPYLGGLPLKRIMKVSYTIEKI